MSEIQELVLDNRTIKEIIHEVMRPFVPYTDNISFHFDEAGIQIIVFPGDFSKFTLPEGHVDIRADKAGYEWMTKNR